MSQDIADMPGIEAAMERFDAIAGTTSAAADTATAPKPDAKTSSTPATRETQAPAQPAANGEAQTSVTSPTDTRAATEPAAGNDTQRDERGRFAQKPEAEKPADPNANDGKSRFAKAQERLEKTWDTVNKRKVELDTQAATLENQRLQLARERAEFDAIRQQADKPAATPEQYLQAAQLKRRDADALRMQARRAEDAGRLDEAERLNKQADKAEGLAEDIAEYADKLKKNPPAGLAQKQQQFEQARKQWTLEASKAFPDLAKDGSRLQQVVAQHLNALAKQDPSLLVHPSLIYHATRLADAQIKLKDLETVAARVPVLEKEAETLRARIKELEAATSPAADAGVARLGETRDDANSLRAEAAALGSGRW